MIEDDPQYINEMAKFMSVIVFDTYYNKQCIGNHIMRVFNWKEVYNKIKLLEQKNFS